MVDASLRTCNCDVDPAWQDPELSPFQVDGETASQSGLVP